MSVASALPLLSPLVTRILELSGFPPQLKTRDLQQVFAAYEEEKGGYKIKWVDDTTALIIFADPSTAKKAYLRTIMSPPAQLINDNGVPAKIKPYDGDDASAIISSVSNRQRSRSNAGGVMGSPTKQNAELSAPGTPDSPIQSPTKSLKGSQHARTSSIGRAFGHRRQQSGSNPNLPPKPVAAALFDAANGGPSPANRVLAGVDTLSGIAGLPANPVVKARESAREMSRESSAGGEALEEEMAKLELKKEGLAPAAQISSSSAAGKGFSPRKATLPRSNKATNDDDDDDQVAQFWLSYVFCSPTCKGLPVDVARLLAFLSAHKDTENWQSVRKLPRPAA